MNDELQNELQNEAYDIIENLLKNMSDKDLKKLSTENIIKKTDDVWILNRPEKEKTNVIKNKTSSQPIKPEKKKKKRKKR